MHTLYFAYGSNLKFSRMRARVPAAEVAGPALLRGRRLALDKRGSDGSGKANLAEDPDGLVWGVAYRLEVEHWVLLDAHEPGYDRVRVAIEFDGGSREAETYVAHRLTAQPVPFEWYKRLLVEGAREHGLPGAYVALLESLPARPDSESQDLGRR